TLSSAPASTAPKISAASTSTRCTSFVLLTLSMIEANSSGGARPISADAVTVTSSASTARRYGQKTPPTRLRISIELRCGRARCPSSACPPPPPPRFHCIYSWWHTDETRRDEATQSDRKP